VSVKKSLVRLLVVTGIVILTTVACSTVDYSKPVDDFTAATKEAETVLSQLNRQVTDAYAEILRDNIASGDALVRISQDDCQTDSARCRLVIVYRDGEEEPYPPEPALKQMTLVMGAISTYAVNLKSLLDADTAKKVESQVNAAMGSIQNLAQTVSKINKKEGTEEGKVPEFATPIGEAVNWLAGQYVERVKFRGLQQATEAAKPVVRKAADLFEDTASFASDVPRATLAEEVSTANDTFRSRGNKSNLNSFAKSAAKYDALLLSTPSSLFERLGAAHDALANKLEGQPLSFASVTAQIEAFAAEAKQLAKILKNIKAIGAKE